MAKLYLDEDVNILLASLLRSRNIDVVTTLEANRLGASDTDQLTFASSLQAAIVTHNRVDFEELFREYLAEGKNHWGIVVLVRRNVHMMTERLVRFGISSEDTENRLFYV